MIRTFFVILSWAVAIPVISMLFIAFLIFWAIGAVLGGIGDCFTWLSVNSVVLISEINEVIPK